jgi:ACS family pantothenate transporter-like MFS transporter
MAAMFSGYLQAAAYKGLNGALGHQGWQWLFIICGIISLPVGILGYFFNPDFPENTRAFYLTAAEAEFAKKRLIDDGYSPLGASAWDRKKILRIAKTWQFWTLPIGYFLVQSSLPNQQPTYALWLKSKKHTVYQINVWPTGQSAVGLVVQILAGMLSDSPLLNGRRWQALSLMQSVTIFASIILAIWSVPDGLKYFAFYIAYFAAGVPGIFYSWFPDLMPHDHEMRGFLIALSNVFSYINQIWWSDAVWRTIEAPKFRPGFIGATVAGVLLLVLSQFLRFMEKRDAKRRVIENRESRQIDVEAPAVVADLSIKVE